MDAVKFLNQLKNIDAKIQNKTEERERHLSLAVGTTANSNGDRVQTSGGSQSMATSVTIAADILLEIEELEEKRKEVAKEIESVIEQLELKEYRLSYLLYIRCLSVQESAEMLEHTASWGFKLKKVITRNVQKVLDDMVKNE